MSIPTYLKTDNLSKNWHPSKGFAIFFNTDADRNEVQKIDELLDYSKNELKSYNLRSLKNDDEAKKAAQKLGYEFNDKEYPYKVTNLEIINKKFRRELYLKLAEIVQDYVDMKYSVSCFVCNEVINILKIRDYEVQQAIPEYFLFNDTSSPSGIWFNDTYTMYLESGKYLTDFVELNELRVTALLLCAEMCSEQV